MVTRKGGPSGPQSPAHVAKRMAGKAKAATAKKGTELIKAELVNNGVPDGVVVMDTTRRVVRRKGNIGVASSKISQSERLLEAMSRRISGQSWVKIAEEMDYPSAAKVKEELAPLMEMVVLETAREIRAVNFGRLEHMMGLLWPDINRGDRGAMSLALQVIDRIEKLVTDVASVPKEDSSQPQGDAVLVIGEDAESYIAGLKALARRTG